MIPKQREDNTDAEITEVLRAFALVNGELCQDLGADYFETHNDPQAQLKRLSKRIEALGFEVTVTERVA